MITGWGHVDGRPVAIVAWPSAEISVMGAEGAAEILFRDAPNKADMVEAYRKMIDVYIAAGNGMVDDVIDPRETRPTIIKALQLAEGKKLERPYRKRGVIPV